ncbi:MAG: DUF2490 domain-containing protein [Parabacteroides sp.]
MKRQLINFMICLLLCSFGSTRVSGKEGAAVYFKISLQGKLYRGLYFLAEEDYRADEGIKGTNYLLTTGELHYRLHKQLRLGAGYTFLCQPGDREQQRNRYYLYATGNLPIGRFRLSLRERFQSTYKVHSDAPVNYLRSMLTLSYRPPRSAFSPFIYSEIFNRVGQHRHLHLDKIRLSGGCNYALNPHHAFQLYYRYNIVYVNDPINHKHCIGLCYTYHF